MPTKKAEKTKKAEPMVPAKFVLDHLKWQIKDWRGRAGDYATMARKGMSAKGDHGDAASYLQAAANFMASAVNLAMVIDDLEFCMEDWVAEQEADADMAEREQISNG